MVGVGEDAAKETTRGAAAARGGEAYSGKRGWASREPGGSRTSADQTEYARGAMMMGEVGGDVPISGGDDEPTKDNEATRWTTQTGTAQFSLNQ